MKYKEEIYIPKQGKTEKSKVLYEAYGATFLKVTNQKDVRALLLYTFFIAGDKLLKEDYLDLEKDRDFLGIQDLDNYFYNIDSPKYRNGYFVEGYELLKKYRGQKKKERSFRLQSRSNKEISSLLSSLLLVINGYRNHKEIKFNCANTIVSLFGMDIESNEYLISTNSTTKYVSECTFQKEKKNNLKKGKKKTISAANNSEICEINCGKTSCAERNFLAECEYDDVDIDPKKCFIIINHDEKDFGACSLCDEKLLEMGVPIVINLTNPNVIYVNKTTYYKNLTTQIEKLVGEKYYL